MRVLATIVILLLCSLTLRAEGRMNFNVVGPFGGDVRSLVVDPVDPDRYYLGTNDGQLYISTDGAASWRRILTFNHPGYSVDKIVIDERAPNTIYVPIWYVANDHQGTIMKSTDRGETWRELTSISNHSVRALAIAPSNHQMLVAIAIDGAYQSDDAGERWYRITPENHPELVRLHSVAIDPVDSKIIYIGTEHLPWKTTDGGKSWRLVKGHASEKRLQLIDDSDIFTMTIDRQDRNRVLLSACSGIYRTLDGAETWTKFQGIPFTSRRTHVIYPDPVKSGVIYSGTTEGLWKTIDAGATWRPVTSLRTVVNAISIHPARPERVVIGTKYGGVMVSDDGGNSFRYSNHGFVNRHVSVLLDDRGVPGRVYAATLFSGFEAGLYRSDDGGNTWRVTGRGLEAQDIYSLLQSTNDKVFYAGTNAGLFKSTDHCETWTRVGGTPAAKVAVKKVARRSTTAVSVASGSIRDRVTDMAYYEDSKIRTVLIASWNGLFKMPETGPYAGRLIPVPIADYKGRVLAVGAHPQQPHIYAGTTKGLFHSQDGGKTWTLLSVSAEEQTPVVQVIAVSPHDPELLMVGTQNGCYISRDGGKQWQRRGKGIPYGEPMAIRFSLNDPDRIVVGDFRTGGVYVSNDRGETFTRVDAGLSSDRIRSASFASDGSLLLGSFSGGIYRAVDYEIKSVVSPKD